MYLRALRNPSKLSELMDDLSDVTLVELEPDHADEPVLVSENTERIVSVVEKDGQLPADNVSSRSNCKRSTAPDLPKKCSKPLTKDHYHQRNLLHGFGARGDRRRIAVVRSHQ